MAASDALALYFHDLGVGTVGTDIFQQHAPDEPDALVLISDTGGGAPTLTKGDDTDSPSWQVLARDLDPDVLLTKLSTIFVALHGLTETTLHGEHFKLVWALQSAPVPLGRDEKQRFRFVQNYRAYVTGVPR